MLAAFLLICALNLTPKSNLKKFLPGELGLLLSSIVTMAMKLMLRR
jgi:hypothetical protein